MYASSVVVRAFVECRGEELTEQIAVRGVDLDPVEARRLCPAGGRGIGPDQLLDVLER